jgi:exonuclease SbcC
MPEPSGAMTWRTTMSDVPVRRLVVSDFRRIEGTREFPLDAPVVLIHGQNGTGKTSVLSALELALTGEIRSMERHSEHYRAHLPFLGQSSATVRVEVSQDIQGGMPGGPLTVSGSQLEGTPALNQGAAKFYTRTVFPGSVVARSFAGSLSSSGRQRTNRAREVRE